MKKFGILLAVIAMLFSLAACERGKMQAPEENEVIVGEQAEIDYEWESIVGEWDNVPCDSPILVIRDDHTATYDGEDYSLTPVGDRTVDAIGSNGVRALRLTYGEMSSYDMGYSGDETFTPYITVGEYDKDGSINTPAMTGSDALYNVTGITIREVEITLDNWQEYFHIENAIERDDSNPLITDRFYHRCYLALNDDVVLPSRDTVINYEFGRLAEEYDYYTVEARYEFDEESGELVFVSEGNPGSSSQADNTHNINPDRDGSWSYMISGGAEVQYTDDSHTVGVVGEIRSEITNITGMLRVVVER